MTNETFDRRILDPSVANAAAWGAKADLDGLSAIIRHNLPVDPSVVAEMTGRIATAEIEAYRAFDGGTTTAAAEVPATSQPPRIELASVPALRGSAVTIEIGGVRIQNDNGRATYPTTGRQLPRDGATTLLAEAATAAEGGTTVREAMTLRCEGGLLYVDYATTGRDGTPIRANVTMQEGRGMPAIQALLQDPTLIRRHLDNAVGSPTTRRMGLAGEPEVVVETNHNRTLWDTVGPYYAGFESSDGFIVRSTVEASSVVERVYQPNAPATT